MRRTIVFLALAVGVIWFMISSASQSWAGEGIVKMVGEITAIDLGHKTVVVEVPVGKDAFG
jgi:hypothetical protein